MKPTLTTGGIVVAVGGLLLVNLGFSQQCSNEIIQVLPVAIGALMAHIDQVKSGKATLFGSKV